MQQSKLGCREEGGGRREDSCSLSVSSCQLHSCYGRLSLLWPTCFDISPPLQSDIFSWPFLCCLTSFTLAFLASHSPRSCWEPVSFSLAASAISPFCHPPTGPHTGSNPRANGRTGAPKCTAGIMSMLVGTVHSLQCIQSDLKQYLNHQYCKLMFSLVTDFNAKPCLDI